MFNLRKDYQAKEQSIATPQQPQNLSASSQSLLEPQQIEVNGYKFIISKMPCTVAQEVIFKLPTGLMPLLSNFTQTEEMVIKMLSYCERVYDDGRPNVPLINKHIIDNHVPDFSTLMLLEQECLKYNYDFFRDGKLLDFLNKGVSLVESKASGILTDLLDRLLQAGVQHSTN